MTAYICRRYRLQLF